MNLVDQLVEVALLGATWVLYLLFALSAVAFAAMFERGWFFRRNQSASEALRRDLGRAIANEDNDAIGEVLERNQSFEATVLRPALGFRRGGSGAFLDAVESSLAYERKQLDRGGVLLGTIGNNAPFVGLFGTVLGVIEAFSYLGDRDPSAMDNVMSGIAEALVATAVGIFVAIPAVVAYNLVQKRAGELESNVAALARLLSAWIQLPRATPQAFEQELTSRDSDDEPANEPTPLARARTADGAH
jgi:biopolymer transport protein ExbB/TolQ